MSRPFCIVVLLSIPLPAAGNLLLDVLNSSPENNTLAFFFDAEATTGDTISRVNGTEGQPANLTGSVNTAALVTRFSTVAVPEPSTILLLGLATLMLVSYSFYDACSPLHKRGAWEG